MKNIYTVLCLILLLVANKIYSQNEELVIWKNGVAIYTQSTSLVAMDSITFRPASEVTICNQVWATRNLDVTTYRNGDPIPQVTDIAQWGTLTTGAWCYYNNDPANGATYGKLYNWYAVNDPRGLAPAGWHVPSDSEWTTLTDCLGGLLAAGGKMKSTGTLEAGTGLWTAPNESATNSSGFSGLPGGYRQGGGGQAFVLTNGMGYWWSSSEVQNILAWQRYLHFGHGAAAYNGDLKTTGLSVRCLRD